VLCVSIYKGGNDDLLMVLGRRRALEIICLAIVSIYTFARMVFSHTLTTWYG